MRIFLKFIEKEFFHIIRDRRTTMILLIMPIILIILFGYAITNEIKSTKIGVVDLTQNEESRKITEALCSNEYFELYGNFSNQNDAEIAMRKGKIAMIVIYRDGEIQLIVDSTDPNYATQISKYANMIITPLQPNSVDIIPITHLLYNPQMKSSYTFVPGVMGLILILICAMMTSIGIVKEKEIGTMEVLLVSPIKPIYIILAKAAPYLIISLINIVTILLLSRYLLNVPINGSIATVLGISILYTFVAQCLGLLVSTIVSTQQAAMLFCSVILMLPVILLSGMIFPIENMPIALQYVSNIVPAKWYIIAIKKVMIMGLGIESIIKEILILATMMLLIISICVKRFKVRL